MKILKDISMKKYTTVHIGGNVKLMYVPESEDELLDLIKTQKPSLFVGGGSNILVSDREFDSVVSLREFNRNIQNNGNGEYLVGGSVRLQTLINTINQDGFGGIEYLFSVPGLVGGATVMNAGGGIAEGNSISDYIIEVNCIVDGEFISLKKDQCEFGHRTSIFKETAKYIVTSVKFQFEAQEQSISEQKKKNRLDFCKKTQDSSSPNFGSVFKVFNPYIMVVIRKLQTTHKSGVHFSKKTDNWICNNGNGTFSEAYKRINRVIKIHQFFHYDCIPEVIIWK